MPMRDHWKLVIAKANRQWKEGNADLILQWIRREGEFEGFESDDESDDSQMHVKTKNSGSLRDGNRFIFNSAYILLHELHTWGKF